MTFRQFNSTFRPMVNQAWLQQCETTGTAANNKTARDRWYREQLYAVTRGRIRTTKDASQKEYRILIDQFSLLAKAAQRPMIAEWTDAQNVRFAELANKAWPFAPHDTRSRFNPWLDSVLESCGIMDRTAPDRKESFDEVMAALAIIANDDYWLSRTATAAETRMRWQITRFMGDLEWLQKRHVDTSYVEAIWRQANLRPETMNDAPVEILAKALAMLDTHIRRLCKDYDIRPMELPSRAHPHKGPVTINEANHHLHIGHAIEHCEPVHVSAHQEDLIPF